MPGLMHTKMLTPLALQLIQKMPESRVRGHCQFGVTLQGWRDLGQVRGKVPMREGMMERAK